MALPQFDVSTHSRLKAAGGHLYGNHDFARVSTHSRLKAAGGYPACFKVCIDVSTHSRLKAAGKLVLLSGGAEWFQHTAA